MTASEPLSDIHDSTLYIFIDESGNFDFSERGTRHFVMAGVATLQPMESAKNLQLLRYKLLSSGEDVSDFHASEDKQVIRNEVFGAISKARPELVCLVSCAKVDLMLSQDAAEVQALLGKKLMEEIFSRISKDKFQQVVVIFDRSLTKKKQADLKVILKPFLKSLSYPFFLYFQSMSRDMNGQMADYFAWAKFVSLERNEFRPWKSLKNGIVLKDFNVFS